MIWIDPRIAKKAQALAIVEEEPWSTTEEVAAEMQHTVRFVQSLLMDLHTEGKLTYQQSRPSPRKKFVLSWRAKEEA